MNHEGKTHVTWITTGLGSGGAEMMLWQIINCGDRTRFAHSVISLTPGGKYVAMLEGIGVPVISLEMKPGRPGPVALFKLMRAVRRLSPDVINGWMYHGDFAALLARNDHDPAPACPQSFTTRNAARSSMKPSATMHQRPG